MRAVFRIGTLAALILTVALHSSFGRGEIIDRIVAIVNDEIITFSELEEFRKSFYRQAPKENDWLEHEFDLLDLRLQVLNTLIDERLIDQEANRQRISVTQKQLDDTIESLRKEQGLSQSQLEMTLKARGMTFETYREQVEKGLKRTRLINRSVKSKIEVTEENLRTYYETHSQNYLSEESVRISHISLPVPQNPTDDQDESVLSIVRDIMRRAEKGEDFASLALQRLGSLYEPETRSSSSRLPTGRTRVPFHSLRSGKSWKRTTARLRPNNYTINGFVTSGKGLSLK